ncbi:MAG: phosphonopyruvate decarboxylase [Spirochaetales bacterium]|nr:phosphonopyruvate decarboxylase [Spirochaetales bacterium]
MIDPVDFLRQLQLHGTEFFTGVPDSLLKSLCAYITDTVDSKRHIIAANEGNAIALASGYHLASSTIPFVYMQNSGQGNAINPLLSLADEEVYKIPMLLCVGWRGEPTVKDEPQHVKQGKVTASLFEAMGIPCQVLSSDRFEMIDQIQEAYASIKKRSAPYALIIRKNTFSAYTRNSEANAFGSFTREEALRALIDGLRDDAIVVSTTGMASRELYELREARSEGHERDFLTVGSMGHASQIALGIALKETQRNVVCIDGDGSALMHLGGMAIIGSLGLDNYLHVIINNGAHDSVGGQPTVGKTVDFLAVAKGLGYKTVKRVESLHEISSFVSESHEGPVCVEIRVKKGNRSDLGRPKTTPVENKEAFMHYVSKEGR